MTDLGLYLHIPFCRAICSYCDFYKMQAKTPRIRQYVDYIIKEIDLQEKRFLNANEPFKPTTLYIGGGTPSFIPLSDFKRLLERLNQWFSLETLKEFTIEANPEDLTSEFIDLCKHHHVSRLSIGVQSFNPLAHQVLKRKSVFSDLAKQIDMLKKAGFTNFNLDLMFGIPGMDLESVKEDLELFLSLEPTHMSCYSLILEERTLLYHQYLNDQFKPIDEDLEANIYQLIKETLTCHGFNHYRDKQLCSKPVMNRFIISYIGITKIFRIGAGSSSYLNDVRWKTVSNLDQYFALLDQGIIGREEEVKLSKPDQMKEEVMLGLRKTKGISLEVFRSKYGEEFLRIFPQSKDLIEQGYLRIENDYLMLNPEYHFLANYVLRKLI